MQHSIPEDVEEYVNELTDDELDFIEREVFYAFDDAYAAYHQDGLDTLTAIRMYEQALDTIRAVRNIRDGLEKEKFEQAKEIHSSLS